MVSSQQPNLLGVDWSQIPAPSDDGSASHLEDMRVPSLALPSTDGARVDLSTLSGTTVLFAYPRTGRPGQISTVDGWDMIPGARGCTPQACSFRDLFAELKAAGAAQVFGISTQDTDYQREAAQRLHLPFPLLSDAELRLARAIRLPTMDVADMTLLKRLALIIDDGRITKAFYPVFPPDRNAGDVLDWLRTRASPRS
jgi:peroxiredoxin